MGLANGLRVVLSPPTNVFMYPAGDRVCPDAIGRIKRDGSGACVSSCEKDELDIGYIKKAVLHTGETLKADGWVIEKILSIKLEENGNGNASMIKVNLRKIDRAEKHEEVTVETAFLPVSSLFQR